jgi:hypothetical protein
MKITVIRTLILASLLVILTPALRAQDAERLQALAANDTYPTFSLTLTSGTRNKIMSEYRVGDDMWLTIVQTNLTNHDIDCSSVWGGIDRNEYEATDEDGKPAVRYHRGTESYTHLCILPAGARLPDEVLINRVFKLNRPGKYTIRVSRQEPFVKDEKGEPPVIWSNPITITVLAPEPAPDAAK